MRSIDDRNERGKEGSVVYPIVTAEVNGIKRRALLATGAGSSYASSTLDRLQLRPIRQEFKLIEMMFGTSNKAINIYGLQIGNLNGKFSLQAEVNKVDRKELLTLEKPKCTEMLEQFSYLRGVTIQDDSKKPMLPIHLILGTNEYAKIKTGTRPRIGRPGEPVAEYTRLGWTIMSPGKELDLNNMFLTQTSAIDYHKLCKWRPGNSLRRIQGTAYQEFRRLVRNNPPLPNSCIGSLKRLENLVLRLER